MSKSINLSMLNESKCEVVFTKLNGEERKMICTKSSKFIPEEVIKSIKNPNKSFKPGYNVVYDFEKNDWRAFNDSQVISCRKI